MPPWRPGLPVGDADLGQQSSDQNHDERAATHSFVSANPSCPRSGQGNGTQTCGKSDEATGVRPGADPTPVEAGRSYQRSPSALVWNSIIGAIDAHASLKWSRKSGPVTAACVSVVMA